MSRFLAACRRREVDRPPVWIMRQAGRYLEEYRATRQRAGSFLGLCRNPELAAEVTLQPIRRFGFDAAIIFSDILLPLSPMGVDFAFPDEGGPRIERPLDRPDDWRRLTVPADDSRTAFVAEAVARVRAALPDDVALIGFCGAPWTLASYLVEGGSSREHARVKAALLEHTEEFLALLDTLALAMAAYLRQQVAAGAQAIQVFDSWAGTLAVEEYAEFVVPSLRTLLEALSGAEVPRILYAGGGAHLLPALGGLPCEVLGVDWRTHLGRAAEVTGNVVQGNLDPAFLFAPPAEVGRLTRRMAASAPDRGWVANLGHGILPGTPIEGVEAFLAALRGTR
ncbi:MAG: uroporphyrinogen decarboxylase [Acidobacteriota bacterium]